MSRVSFARRRRPLRRMFLKDFAVMARIGVYAFEELSPQPVLISIDIWVADEPPSSDKLAAVIDYDMMPGAINAALNGPHIRVLETLAERIVSHLLFDPRVLRARVRLAKTEILREAAEIGIVIDRRQGDTFDEGF